MEPIKEEVINQVVNEKRLNIIQRHESLITKIVLTGCLMWVVLQWTAEIEQGKKDAQEATRVAVKLLEVSIELKNKTDDMKDLQKALDERINPKPTK